MKTKQFFLFILAMIFSLNVSAYRTWTDENGTEWAFDISGTNARIVYRGPDSNGDIPSISGTIPAELTIPSTVYNGETAYTVTSIGYYAFSGCSSLTSVTIPEGVTSIDRNAFISSSSLTSVYITNLAAWCNIAMENQCSNPLYYAHHLYLNGEEIKDLVIPEGVTSIGNYAFSGCTGLTSVTIPSSVISIGSGAFSGCTYAIITMEGTTPPTLESGSNWFNASNVFYVPAEAKASYQAAENWANYATQIITANQWNNTEVNVTAQESGSGVLNEIGEDNVGDVVSLKVTGTINGYDIMVMRNKMLALRHLDLSDASIVANDYEYYTGYHTEDNVLGTQSFSGLKLFSVKAPRSITRVDAAFMGCSCLKDVTLYEGVETIGVSAFSGCSSLKTITLPEGVETIQGSAFLYCSALSSITLPQSLKTIEGYVFYGCSSLTSISFPPGLTTIGGSAFEGTGLTEVHIPEMLTSIGDKAFSPSTIKKVYAYTVEPISIGQNTFSNYTSIDLYVPKMTESYYNYYYDTQWSQFLSINANPHDYASFYLNNDYEQGDGDDIISGVGDEDPDATLNNQSGYIKTGDEAQNLGVVDQNMTDSGNGASIIAEDDGSNTGNLNVHLLNVRIPVKANRWYFFCFPFDVTIANCTYPGNYSWKQYDGLLRAQTQLGWKTVTDATLSARRGYAFCSATAGTLVVSFNTPTFGGDRPKTLETHTCDNAQHASWNFVGNPYSSYYEAKTEDFDAPITRWNGSSYEAYRPGDDECHLSPYEAFFVQKPETTEKFDFKAERRETYRQGETKKAANIKARRDQGLNPTRLLLNLTLNDSEEKTIDRTRVVLNDKKSHQYEMDCDAAKFLSAEAPAQLYSLEADGTQYAINERPAQGDIRLGFTAKKDGRLSIGATRLDQPMVLVDHELGVTADLTLGVYDFDAKAGTNNTRFSIRLGGDVTGLTTLRQQTGVVLGMQEGGLAIGGAEGQDIQVFATNGAQVASHSGNGFIALQRGIYVVKVGNNSAKVSVR